ncbi:MAG: hypothetical protein A3F54_05165 [Candidatus Kerfeldbacteria bacterium RIFCSPHIGHO2_12_FULL_48_17]|uniref:Uncharacterized protein n=1 Tax=Candidatus Kerfeldbacteria bacterium RIFCSPHIGHO2_12_FULL_48_17 TaxID=1798542 RepID=A0A1G2B3G3_9BACT|nr:MAG: hypothetical protein A3F54_05165 [Candidatus Kerfeldbacteria bacterium RIFCSPHIGHO2_12_FULL_48_17]
MAEDLTAQFSELVINHPDNLRSICHTYISDPTPLEEKNLGRIFVLIEEHNHNEFAQELFKKIVETLDYEYYHGTDFDMEIAFENALQKLNHTLQELSSEYGDDWLSGFSAVISVLKGEKTHFSAAGRAQAFLIQKDKIIDILSQGSSGGNINPVRIFSSILSGDLRKNSSLLLGTESILEYLSQDRIRRLVNETDSEGVMKKFDSLLRGNASSTNFACVLIKMKNVSAETQGQHSKQKSSNSPVEAKKRVADSMSSLINQERQTSELLSPSLWPNFRKRLKKKDEVVEKKLDDDDDNDDDDIESEDREEDVGAMKEERAYADHREKGDHREKRGKRKPSANKNEAWQIILKKTWEITQKVILKLVSLIAMAFQALWSFIKRQKGTGKKFRSLNGNSGIIRNTARRIKNLPRSRKILLVVALVFIILFAQSVIFQDKKQETKQEGVTIQKNISDAAIKIDEAKAALLYDNENGARAFLLEAQKLLQEIPATAENYNETVVPKLAEVKTQLDAVNHVKTIDSPDIIADFSQVFSDIKLKKIELTKNTLLAFDEANGSIYSSDITNPEPKTLISRPGEDTTTVASNSDGKNVYILSKGKTLGTLNIDGKTVQDVAIGLANGANIVDFAHFSSRMYALDAQNNQIWKHAASGTGFGNGEKWLQEDINLANATSMFIDGSVYIGGSDGKIIKLFSGSTDSEFTLAEIGPGLGPVTAITATENGDKLYILDSTNKRIVILGKDGKLLEQWVLSNLEGTKDMTVNEDETFLYVLHNSQVYQLPLGQ